MVQVQDIIITDLMMPEKKRLWSLRGAEKRGESHVPIVMLTALTNFKRRVSGINKGPDDVLESLLTSQSVYELDQSP